MSTIDARAARLDVYGTVGDDLSITVTVVDSAGDPIDLSGYTTIQADVLRNGTSVATFTDALSGAGDNVITLTLTDAQTTSIGNDRNLTWSLEVDANGSSVTQWLAGDFRLYTQGTPGASNATTATLTATGAVTLTATSVAHGLYLPLTQSHNAQTGTTYTLVLSDANKLVTLTNASPITMTVPPNSSVAFPVGTQIDLAQRGAGAVTVAQGSGVTVNVHASDTLVLDGQYAYATLVKVATDTWDLFGRLVAA